MSEHVKRGATKHTDREVFYEWREMDDGGINSVWHCQECGHTLELRQRRGQHAYVEIGCTCGAESLDVRIADLLEFEMDAWDTETAADLGRGGFDE